MGAAARYGGAAVALVGIPAAMYYSAQAVGVVNPGPWAVLLFFAMLVGQFAAFVFLAKEGAPFALVLIVLYVSWMLLAFLRSDMSEDRRMHDLGVTERAVVTQWIRTSDPMSGTYDEVTAIVLKLPDGDRPRLELKGADAPAVGTSVQVTRDPRGDVPIRLGPRPDAPGGVLATIALIVVLTTSLTLSTAAALTIKDG